MEDIGLVYLVVGILATYRITSLFQREVGPWGVLSWLRSRFGIIHDHLGFPHGYPDTMMGKLFECFWCLSVWVGTGCAIIIVLGGWWILLPFALSGGAILCVEGAEE